MYVPHTFSIQPPYLGTDRTASTIYTLQIPEHRGAPRRALLVRRTHAAGRRCCSIRLGRRRSHVDSNGSGPIPAA
jgi:hypothetical protein